MFLHLFSHRLLQFSCEFKCNDINPLGFTEHVQQDASFIINNTNLFHWREELKKSASILKVILHVLTKLVYTVINTDISLRN